MHHHEHEQQDYLEVRGGFGKYRMGRCHTQNNGFQRK